MWKRLIIFLILLFVLMFIISGIHAQKEVVPAATRQETMCFDAEAIYAQGIAVDTEGSAVYKSSGELVFWNHPAKYFCSDGYLRYQQSDEKIKNDRGVPIKKSQLLETTELSLVEQLLHGVIFPY